jgi:hypothetical protein
VDGPGRTARWPAVKAEGMPAVGPARHAAAQTKGCYSPQGIRVEAACSKGVSVTAAVQLSVHCKPGKQSTGTPIAACAAPTASAHACVPESSIDAASGTLKLKISPPKAERTGDMAFDAVGKTAATQESGLAASASGTQLLQFGATRAGAAAASGPDSHPISAAASSASSGTASVSNSRRTTGCRDAPKLQPVCQGVKAVCKDVEQLPQADQDNCERGSDVWVDPNLQHNSCGLAAPAVSVSLLSEATGSSGALSAEITGAMDSCPLVRFTLPLGLP